LQPLLEQALARESTDDGGREMAVTAQGLAKAAEILAGEFSLVATNVPYLGIRKQCETLKNFVTTMYSDAKEDLATVFCARISHWLNNTTMAVVTPQNWFYQFRYRNHRTSLLKNESIELIARLGEGAFESSQAAGAFAALSIISCVNPNDSSVIRVIDASEPRPPNEKAAELRVGRIKEVAQKSQLSNPDARLSLERPNSGRLLNEFVLTAQGIKTGDDPFWVRCFWEVSPLGSHWRGYQTSSEISKLYAARSWIINWVTSGEGMVRPRSDSVVVGKIGVVASAMREISVTLYSGDLHYSLATPLIPLNPKHLTAIWAFCSSTEYNKAVREIEQNIAVTTDTLAKVPFDLAHWQAVAAEKYPDGLPTPFSSDPTQWLFSGHPNGRAGILPAIQRGRDAHAPLGRDARAPLAPFAPLHVAVARLLGYQWPRQTGSSFPDCPALPPDGLEALADADGIVCLSATKGEAPAAERLRLLLVQALGSFDLAALLASADPSGKSKSKAETLDDWLRDEFFEQHCALFHHRPFIWHIWDGHKSGFSALVNYHKLDHANLEKLTYAYLGDWIRRQQAAVDAGEAGSDARLASAKTLQTRLKLILEGEPPFDIFVRWKPLSSQAIGWQPDLNDGVRMNIRPFMAQDIPGGKKGAGILRSKPNIKWEKDRGKEPVRAKAEFPWFWGWDGATKDFAGVGKEPDGNRWNDCHYSNAVKQAAKQ
ncbi:MAG: SAM-dependent DNA methyltransferase, partial [Rhodoferax sp.]|nr:SAM-dependent DNA methyltransferase [Rhodoferax sp.]